MGLRLSVRESAWLASVNTVAVSMPGVIPVVKGNGYGFGRATLMPIAAKLADRIAVGTVYEAADVPAGHTALVLTPHLVELPAGVASSAVLTVGSVAHVEALEAAGWQGAVAVKLRSSMRRYGVTSRELADVVSRVGSAGLTIDSYALHLPLAGRPSDRIAEVAGWLPHLDPLLPFAIGHVDAPTWAEIRRRDPDRSWHVRVGTALWHAGRSQLHLSADVLDIHEVAAGDSVGYRGVVAAADGLVVIVAAGSANGIRALDDGRSPFHFRQRRLELLEPPHMHSSMLFVPRGNPCPPIGERVDVQRPLTTTTIDELEWRRD